MCDNVNLKLLNMSYLGQCYLVNVLFNMKVYNVYL